MTKVRLDVRVTLLLVVCGGLDIEVFFFFFLGV